MLESQVNNILDSTRFKELPEEKTPVRNSSERYSETVAK